MPTRVTCLPDTRFGVDRIYERRRQAILREIPAVSRTELVRRMRAAAEQIRLDDLAFGLIEHSGEVYGQLSVYYRVAGMIPPESRPKK